MYITRNTDSVCAIASAETQRKEVGASSHASCGLVLTSPQTPPALAFALLCHSRRRWATSSINLCAPAIARLANANVTSATRMPRTNYAA
jgi:hypothetical protein